MKGNLFAAKVQQSLSSCDVLQSRTWSYILGAILLKVIMMDHSYELFIANCLEQHATLEYLINDYHELMQYFMVV
jgi:hypothetical protein